MHGRNRTGISSRHDGFSALPTRHRAPPPTRMHVMYSKQRPPIASSPHLHKQSYANISLPPNFSALFYIFFHFLTPPPPIQSHDANFRAPPPDFSPVKFSEIHPKCHFWNIHGSQTPQFCPKVRPGHPETPPSAPKFDLLITL